MRKAKVIISFLLLPIMLTLMSCSFDDALSKEQIFKLVKDNIDLLKSSTIEVNNIGFPYYVFISTTDKKPIQEEHKDINGLYAFGDKDNSGYSVYEKINNQVLDEVMQIKGLEEISVERTWQYVEYSCGATGLAVSGSYYGFYYVSNDRPIVIEGNRGAKLTPEGNGWRYKRDENSLGYYTERITENWFYYEDHF